MKVKATDKPKAMRFDSGKMDLTYLLEFPKAFRLFCLICVYGEHKYDRGNFRRGGKPDLEYFKSAMRHVQDFYEAWDPGEGQHDMEAIFDSESGLNSLGHALWNLVTFIELNLPDDAIMRFEDLAAFNEHCREVREQFAALREQASGATDSDD